MPLRMSSQLAKFAQGVSASKHAGLAGQMICIKYPMGQKCVQQYRGFAYGDVEPDKKKMIQNLYTVNDAIKIALLLIDKLTEENHRAEVKALQTQIDHFTEAKKNAESELLETRQALSKAQEPNAKSITIDDPKVLQDDLATKGHSKQNQLVNIHIAQQMLDSFVEDNLRTWQKSFPGARINVEYVSKEAVISGTDDPDDTAELLKDHFEEQIEDLTKELRCESDKVITLYDDFETEAQKRLLNLAAKKHDRTFVFVNKNN